MDDLIASLSTRQGAPRLWVERLAIYSEPEADHCIRSISFRRGVNIIWAREPAEGSAYTGIHAAGHGVGKTSLCLMLRYCLGDSAKAIDELRDEVVGEFPNGGVGAVVHVGDETFSVFRFFNLYREGFASSGADLEALLASKGSQPYKAFEASLTESMLARVSPRTIPETGQAIEWRHLLAWMARDQGSRFKSFFSWREGEGTGLHRPRQDPPILMRAVLGLLEQSESQLLGDLRIRENDLVAVQDELARLQQEPQLIRRRIESNVRAWLDTPADWPMYTDDLFRDSVEKAANRAKSSAAATQKRLEGEQSKLEDELVELRLEHRRLQQEHELADNDYKILEAARTNDETAFRKLAEKRKELLSLVGPCEHGGVDFQACQHVQQQIATFSFTDKRDHQAIVNNLGELATQSATALARKQRLEQPLAQANQKVADKRRHIATVQTKRDTARIELGRGTQLLEELERWEKASGSSEAARALQQAEERCKSIKAEIDGLGVRLETLRHERSAREKALNELTNLFARALFSDEAFGTLEIRDESRPFRLSQRGGEAFRVMEVLLGDLVCLLDSGDPASAFPGFLIHDCPREADMGPRPYHDFLHLIERIEREAFGDEASFQYIVTTTTPPPDSLQKPRYLREILDPSFDDGLLFRRRFSSQAGNQSLQGE